MRTIPPIRALLILSRKLYVIFLLCQMVSCELDEIAPTTGEGDSALKSNFEFDVQDPECVSSCVVLFTNRSVHAQTYRWDFGDGTSPSAVLNPSHTYASPGIYNVTLTAFRDTVEHDTTIAVSVNASADTAATPLQAFLHEVTSANLNSWLTTLENPLTDGDQSKIIVATPVLGVRNTAALGMYYYADKWMIFNENTVYMNLGEQFNVIVAEPGPNAFVHQTSSANLRTTYSSTIDHPSLNNKRHARVFITPIWEQYTDYNTPPVGVVYINNRWEIMNLDKSTLPVGLKFNVIVSRNDDQSFIHVTSASSVSADYTVVDDLKTNDKVNLKIITTINQGTSDAAITNPRICGLWYRGFSGNWTIFNETGDAMPQGTSYNVLIVE